MAASSANLEKIKYQSLQAAVDASPLTQRAIAKAVGISESYFCHLLKDGKRRPSLAVALRLARVLDVDLAGLV